MDQYDITKIKELQEFARVERRSERKYSPSYF